jgi:hypothetical protein
MDNTVPIAPTAPDEWDPCLPTPDQLSRHWGAAPFHEPRAASDGAPAFPVETLCELLGGGRVSVTHLELFRSRVQVHPHEYTKPGDNGSGDHTGKMLDVAKVTQFLRGGAGLVFRSVNLYVPAVARLCGLVGSYSGIATAAGAFLSPPGEGVLPLHKDPLHVIVQQSYGEKHWSIYEPFETAAEVGPVEAPPGVAPVLRPELTPGDLLYVAPFNPHLTRSVGSWSLHLSIASPVPLRSRPGHGPTSPVSRRGAGGRSVEPARSGQSGLPDAEDADLARIELLKILTA